MYKTFYAGMDTLAPLLSLALFGGAFIFIVVRTLVFKRAHDFEGAAALPMRDEAKKESAP
jgi:hypothetical protein